MHSLLHYRTNRRALVSGLALLPALSGPFLTLPASAQTAPSASPLPSWNDGATKQAILDFVRATTEQGSSKFVPPEQRIATFDQDGTLWVEHPIYSQVVYCLDRVPAVAEKDPKLRDIEPFKTVLSGNREAIAKNRAIDDVALTKVHRRFRADDRKN